MPSSLAASGTVHPAASLASAWRSLRTICSGECLLPIKSPPYAHRGPLDSHSNWTSFRGAGHVDSRTLAAASLKQFQEIVLSIAQIHRALLRCVRRSNIIEQTLWKERRGHERGASPDTYRQAQ